MIGRLTVLALLLSLGGCVVVPAQPTYGYGYGPGYYYPPPYYYGPSFSLGIGIEGGHGHHH